MNLYNHVLFYFKSMNVIFLALLLIYTSGCAHSRDVRPGTDGVHQIKVRGQDKSSAEQDALAQARHFCEQSKQQMAVLSEKTTYTGSMDEATRNTVRQASTAASILDTPTRSGRRGTLGSAGVVGSTMTSGDDYTTEMTFKCQ